MALMHSVVKCSLSKRKTWAQFKVHAKGNISKVFSDCQLSIAQLFEDLVTQFSFPMLIIMFTVFLTVHKAQGKIESSNFKF